MTRINWDELERLGGGAPLDDEDTQELMQGAAADDLSSVPSVELPSPPPLTDRRDADLALQPGETLADRHGRLVLKAMAVNDEILSLPIDPEYPRVLSTVSSTAQHVMNAQIKIDETRLRVRSECRLPEILARIVEAKRQLDERRTIDIQSTEVPRTDVTVALEAGANDAERAEIAPTASVPAPSDMHQSSAARSYPQASKQIGRHEMPHMRTKR